MFQKVNEWLTERGGRFARGGETDPVPAGAYYASPEAEQAYGGMRASAPDAVPGADVEAADVPEAADPYGGRVPYRSQRDIQAEEEMRRQQMEQQARRQQAAQQQQRTQAFNRQGAQPAAYQQPQSPQQQNNVLPFPGMIRGPEGNLYAHVEYIVLLRNRNECTKVIEYIKSNASVFLNMEFIANDSERQRCVDMLSGAAYTLGCSLRKISQRGIYLISSPSVYVVVDQAMQKYTSARETPNYGYAAPATAGYTAQPGVGYAAQPAGYGYAGAQPQGYRQQSYAAPNAGYAAPGGYGYAAQAEAGYASRPGAGYSAQPAGYGYAQPERTAYAAQPSAFGMNAAPQAGYEAPQNAYQAGFAANARPDGYRAQHAPRQAAEEDAYPPAAAAASSGRGFFGMAGNFSRNDNGMAGR